MGTDRSESCQGGSSGLATPDCVLSLVLRSSPVTVNGARKVGTKVTKITSSLAPKLLSDTTRQKLLLRVYRVLRSQAIETIDVEASRLWFSTLRAHFLQR